MTNHVVSDSAPVDTHVNLLTVIEQVLGPEHSDDSQISGLKGLSLGESSTGGSETPLSQWETSERERTQKPKKKKKASEQVQKGAQQGILQGSPSPRAGLEVTGLNRSTPILQDSPDGSKNTPFQILDDGGSTTTEEYPGVVSEKLSMDGRGSVQ